MISSKITAVLAAFSMICSTVPAFDTAAAEAVTTTTAAAAQTASTTKTAAVTTTAATTAKTTTAATTAKTTAATATTKVSGTASDSQEHLVYDAETGVLTLHGEFTSAEIRGFKYVSKIVSIVAAEDAVFHGGVSVGGLINTERLDVLFDFGSSANAIGGSFIKIRRKGVVAALFVMLFGKLKNALFHVKNSIEGDVIDIEYVVADSVIGRDVKIGPGCKIGCVIYGDTIEIDKSAEVDTYKQGE